MHTVQLFYGISVFRGVPEVNSLNRFVIFLCLMLSLLLLLCFFVFFLQVFKMFTAHTPPLHCQTVTQKPAQKPKLYACCIVTRGPRNENS